MRELLAEWRVQRAEEGFGWLERTLRAIDMASPWDRRRGVVLCLTGSVHLAAGRCEPAWRCFASAANAEPRLITAAMMAFAGLKAGPPALLDEHVLAGIWRQMGAPVWPANRLERLWEGAFGPTPPGDPLSRRLAALRCAAGDRPVTGNGRAWEGLR